MHIIFETLNNEFYKFHYRKFQWNPSSGRPTWNGQRLKLFLKIFHFWEFFNLGKLSMRIKPPEKFMCFSTSFECAFEPSIIIFRAPLSPHFLSSVPSSPWPSKVVFFLTLPPFLRALSSPYPLSNVPSSLRSSFLGRLWALISFQVRLRALNHLR